MYTKNPKKIHIKLGDIYRNYENKYFIITGFHKWGTDPLGDIAYIQQLGKDIKGDQYTLQYIGMHCDLISRVDE